MQIVVSGVKPYDGAYQLDFASELTTREWGWIKRLAGYMPLNLHEAVAGGDPEFMCALAAIAIRRAGRAEAAEVPAVFERMIDAPYGSAITAEIDEGDYEEDEDGGDAGPPERSLNGSEPISGPASKTNSEISPASPDDSGTPESDISASDQPTWVS